MKVHSSIHSWSAKIVATFRLNLIYNCPKGSALFRLGLQLDIKVVKTVYMQIPNSRDLGSLHKLLNSIKFHHIYPQLTFLRSSDVSFYRCKLLVLLWTYFDFPFHTFKHLKLLLYHIWSHLSFQRCDLVSLKVLKLIHIFKHLALFSLLVSWLQTSEISRKD